MTADAVRLARLHAASRRLPMALALLAACAAGLRAVLSGHWDAYGALQLPLIFEACCAAVIAVTTGSPFGEPERAAGRRLPYLRLVYRTGHWRVYAVADPTPIVSGAATLEALGPNSLTLTAARPGDVLARVRFTPYWALGEGSGCVSKSGEFTALRLRRAGPVTLVIRFALSRIGADSPRCN